MAEPLTFSLIALDGTPHSCTLYLLDCDLTPVMSMTVLGTVVDHCAPCHHTLPPCYDVSLLDCRGVTPWLTSVSRI
jgi:hypothetical protein